MGLTHDISIIKQDYRELFEHAHERLKALFLQQRDLFTCSNCPAPPEDITEVLHFGCGYRDWQASTILLLEKQLGKEILETLNDITIQRDVIGACHSCGVCCRLASSPFSYAELLDKADHDDSFARQFTSVFVPYASHDAARKAFPEEVGEILDQTDGDVHFYHCPHLQPDMRCGIYTDPRRPKICATYPETPLTLMYKNCGYQPWKDEKLPTTLMAHATLELCQHYANKILDAFKQPGAVL